MSTYTELLQRANGKCELCDTSNDLNDFLVSPKSGTLADDYVAICNNCKSQIENNIDSNYWKILNESIWSPIPAVQALSYRIAHQFQNEGWASSLLDTVFLDEEAMEWALYEANKDHVIHKDSNGNVLQNGDSVTLIQDLDVKGANFVAKRGTLVKRISLVTENPEQIEGKVNDQSIVILTKYVKKA